MNSWDRHTIIEKVIAAADKHGALNPQQQKQLIFGCTNAPEREVFFGLFSFFYDESLQENKFQRQQLAGTLLYSVSPDSPLALDGSIYGAAKRWDLSVEDLPWYWCKKFGKSRVVEFLTETIGSVAEPDLEQSLKTMLFWANNYEEHDT